MKWKLIFLGVIPFVAAWGCGKDAKQAAPPTPPPPTAAAPTLAPFGPAERPKASAADVAEAVKGNNAFALDLYAKLAAEKKDGNVFFSPFSISTALSMTYGGARGKTAEEMKKALHFALADEKLHPAMGALISDLNAAGKAGGFQLNVANALWGQKGHQFLPEFLALNKASYGAGLETVDFAGDAEAARRTINAWVEKQTQDKIKDLMPPGTVSDLTRLVLTNAVYFKGRWAAPFDKKATEESPFQVSLQKKVQVPMMYLTTYLPFKQDNWSVEDEYSTETNNQTKFGFRALWLPYVDEKLLADPLYKENGIIAAPQQQPLSMIVFLPRRVDGLAELEQMLTSDKLQKWLEEFKIEEVRVYLPKFKITAEFRLDGALQDLGVRSAFDAQAADFSGIDGAKGFCLGAAMHKAYVEVNEEGTEAAAASAVSDMIGVPPTFKADHPFVFLIRDNRSGSILFLGRVANPAPGSPEGTPKK